MIALYVFAGSLVALLLMLYIRTALVLGRERQVPLPDTTPSLGEAWFSVNFLDLAERTRKRLRKIWRKTLYRLVLVLARAVHRLASAGMQRLRKSAERLEQRLEHS